MKYFATFASLLLLACAVATQAANHQHHSRHHHSKHHVARHPFESRAAGDNCNWQCVDDTGKVVTPGDIDTSKSWSIDIVAGASSTVTLSIFFDVSTGAYVVFNRAINMAIVFVGNLQYFAILNLNTSVGLVVNFSTKYAIVYDLSADLVAAFSTNISSAISLSASFLISKKADITSFWISTNRNAFNFGTLINLLAVGNLGYTVVFLLNGSLQTKFQNSFGTLMTVVSSRLVGGVFVDSYGVFNVLVGVFGTVKSVQESYLNVVYYIAVNGGGFVSTNVALVFRLNFSVAIYIGGLIAGTLQVAKVVTGGVVVFISISGQEAFRVLATGAVSIGGAIVGAVGGAISAISSLVGGFSFNAGFSFGFSAGGSASGSGSGGGATGGSAGGSGGGSAGGSSGGGIVIG